MTRDDDTAAKRHDTAEPGSTAEQDRAAGPTGGPPAVRLESLRIGYRAPSGTRWIIEDIDLELPPGELVLLLGPSGGGKSTLVSALLGLDDPFAPQLAIEGQLELLGEQVRGPLPATLAGRVGAVFQDGALIDDLSVRANVTLAARELSGRTRAEAEALSIPERVKTALGQVGLSHPPNEVAALSGGQRKRVALARALVGDPEFLVLDEPTAGLDPRSAKEIAELIRDVHEASEKQRTTWVITHDLEAFRDVAHRAVCIDPRSGTLTSVSIDELDPALERMAAREAVPAGPPPVAAASPTRRAGAAIGRVLLGLARIPTVTGLALRRLAPYHLGMVARSVVDHCLSPALFLAIAGATAGGLATTFALDNNPLEGAFRREVLLGTGKVLVSAALPLLVGVLFAARTAAGATARLGGFRRSRVFESLPLLGVEPARFLLTPLVWGSAIGALVGTAVGVVSGLAASLWVTQLELGLTPFGWASAAFASVDGSDFQWAALKAVLGGIATALACYALASSPKRSQADVARATNDALVASTLLVLVIHGALTVIQFA